VAEAEGIAPDTVLAALGVERGRESWESRRELLEELPSIVGDLLVTVRLIWKFLQTTTCGIDLWFARETLRRIARGEVTSEALESSPEMVRAEAAEYAERLLEHLDDEKRRQAKTLVEDQRRPIPDGAFLAGSPEGEDGRYDDEGPQHPVTIESGFPIMAVPVTNEMFELFDPDHREHRAFREQVSDEELRGHPVVNVTWWEAMLFAEWVGCRLPLEAEWEYACRAKTTTRYWRGDGEQHLAEVGWYGKNSGDRTHAVAEKPANPWGLHDVHGNVWEWCLDVWEGSYQSRRDGVIIRPDSPAFDPASDAWRVVRGGGWFDVPGSARSACRYDGGPRNGWLGQGFRLVLLPLPPARGS
jgi:formylglycine-generating enzyme required for sulfatase activity